jgi:hypothetical protein
MMPKHAKRLSEDVMLQRVEIGHIDVTGRIARHHHRAQCGGLIT